MIERWMSRVLFDLAKFDEYDEYAEELMKCIEDDFDYTIEKYGTRVPTGKRPKIIYD